MNARSYCRMAEQSNSSSNSVKVFNENDNQENSLLHTNNKSTNHLKGNPNVQGFGDKLGLLATPRAKNVLTNRKVLADKTPNNSNIQSEFLHKFNVVFYQLKDPYNQRYQLQIH